MNDAIKLAQELLKNAYAPYSNFPVSCVVVTKDQEMITGVNVENISFGGTICAERNAINHAITLGYRKGDFDYVVIMAKTKNPVRPCAICRQTFVEFFDEDVKIIMCNELGEHETMTVSQLVPYAFNEVLNV